MTGQVDERDFTLLFLRNLPIYRQKISPAFRGLEIGLAHGYFLIGPFIAWSGSTQPQIKLALLLTLALIGGIAIALSTYKPTTSDSENRFYWLKTPEDWSLFRGSFLIGGASGAFFVYFLLENMEVFQTLVKGFVS